MTEISFYHLERVSLELALPALLEKTMAIGKKALVMAGSVQRVEALNDHLWSYHPDSWLPHGSRVDGNPDRQPIWLSTSDENLNNADFLFLTDGAHTETFNEFERCFEIFDGNSPAVVANARERYRAYKGAGHTLSYFQQVSDGRWQKKG